MTTTRDIVIYAGEAFTLSLPYAGTAGRGQRAHIRTADATATVVQILTHNGATNARVLFDGTDAIDLTIGGSVSAAWVVGANRVEWVYDIEDYSLTDVDDVEIPYRGKVIVYGNRTRESDVSPSEQMPSGDGRYVRFDGVQGLSAGQQLQARENIGAGTGGGGGTGDVVGPTSATDDRIAAFDGVTGKLIKQGSVTATAVASHLGSTSNPHSVTAAQVGADATGTAAGAVSTHNSVTTAHGISAFGATLVDDADAATARTTLGLGTAATSASGDFAAASHAHAASAITSGTLAHERGGLEADVSAYSGLVKIAAGATSAVTVTAAGEALLDDADASAQRTTLGLGGAATLAVGTTAGTVAAGDHTHTQFTTQSQATWEAGAGTTESVVSPAKVAAAIAALGGGGGLTKFTEAESTSSPNATVYVDSLTAAGASTNADAAIVPKGSGALLARVPDGTATTGNKRGTYAVDLQLNQGAAARVASGAYSTISGGNSNTASANGSGVGGGTLNVASGADARVGGGSGCTASGTAATVSGGNGNTASANYGTVGGGFGNVASGSGTSAIAGGKNNAASGVASWCPGGEASTSRAISYAGAYSMVQRAAVGDRQTMVLPIACAARTDATATVMTSDAGAASTTNQMVLPNNSSMFFEVDVVAHDSSLKSASWKVQGTIRRGANAAATTIVGANVTTPFGNDLSGGSPGVTCTADTTNGALCVTFTGIAATTIYPSGHIRTVIAA